VLSDSGGPIEQANPFAEARNEQNNLARPSNPSDAQEVFEHRCSAAVDPYLRNDVAALLAHGRHHPVRARQLAKGFVYD
jgi:hypothetical protein